jgi:hypothetical protein
MACVAFAASPIVYAAFDLHENLRGIVRSGSALTQEQRIYANQALAKASGEASDARRRTGADRGRVDRRGRHHPYHEGDVMQNVHCGWTISHDNPPIPCRDFDWSASSPDYDCDCDEDGFFVVSGQVVHARTRDALIAEIDAAIAEGQA